MVAHVAVRVPVVVRARVDQLDDPHSAFDQPAGDQALVAERGRVAFLDSVGGERGSWFRGRCRVLRVPRASFLWRRRTRRSGRGGRDRRARAPAWRTLTSRSMICSSSCNVTGRSGRPEVGYRLRARHDPHALVDRRQEAAVPDLRAGVRHVLAEHHVRRQRGVERAQAIAEPGTQARHRHGGRAGVHGEDGLKMLDDVGVQACGSRTDRRPSSPGSGNSSLIMRPDWPHAWNRNGEPKSGRSWVSSLRRPKLGTDLP